MKYSARQLSIILGVQPSTITRDIKKGKVSAERNERGEYEIEASEIVRAYQDRVTVDDAGNIAATAAMQSEAMPAIENATPVLQVKLEAAERLLSDREQVIADLREDRDHWRQQAERATLLLADESRKSDPVAATPPPVASPEPAKESAAPRGLRGWLHRVTA